MTTPQRSTTTRWTRPINLLGIGILLTAVAIPLVVLLIGRFPASPRPAMPVEPVPAAESAGPIYSRTQVLSLARQLKLLTVELDATVSVTATDERWRGTASASVRAPVRYHYGVDLSGLDDDAVDYDYLTQTYTLTLPEPEVVAVEVDLANAVSQDVQATWTRWESMSGREQLIRAQRAAREHAKAYQLTEQQRDRVRQMTLEQARQAFATFAAPTARLQVRYATP